MGRVFVYISGFIGVFAYVSFAAAQTSHKLAMFDIEEGETAFVIDRDRLQGWWIFKDECRRHFQLERAGTVDGQGDVFTSVLQPETVRIGRRTLTLRQNFRFYINTTARLEVYSSARGGWSQIAAHYEPECQSSFACQSYMDLPEC